MTLEVAICTAARDRLVEIDLIRVEIGAVNACKAGYTLTVAHQRDAASAAHADYTLLAGDFNCSDASSVHRFLCGEQSLLGHDAYFFDLAIAYSAQTDIPPEPTLDFRQNPRWGVIDPPNTLEKNERFDRIYLANPYPGPAPILREFGVFGKEISAETRLAPSDHYGVYAFLDLS